MPRSLLALALFAALIAAAPIDAASKRDADIFVRDTKKPNLLHLTDRAAREGFGREWVETMARPPIDSAVLDQIEAIKGPRKSRIHPPGMAPNPALATRSGEVIIIQGNNLVVNTQGGLSFDHNNGFFDVANAVLSQFGDNFDFISVWTTFPDTQVAAYYFPIKQDTQGLGDCNFNSGETFGCEFDQSGGGLERLQGLVFMNSVSMWQSWDQQYDGVVHALDSYDSACYSTLGQEIAHRWGSGLRFLDPRNGTISKKLLGRDLSHWAAWLDSDASVMDGWDWEVGADRFELINDMDRFSDLDLYTMGALRPGEVRPFFFIEQARFDAPGFQFDGQVIPADAVLQLPSVQSIKEDFGVNIGGTGTRVDLTMQDVLNAEGPRVPSADDAPRAFRQAFVLITQPGETEAQAEDEAQEIGMVQQTWEAWWGDRTRQRLRMCTTLDGDCVHGIASLSGDDDTEIDVNADGTLDIRVRAEVGVVNNAVLTVRLAGQGAEDVSLKEDTFEFGNIVEGSTKTASVELSVDDSYACGVSFVVEATLTSSNAATVTQSFRLIPGYGYDDATGFPSDLDGFEINSDGEDGASAGAFEWRNLSQTPGTTALAAPFDNSPNNDGAIVTAELLQGDTSLWTDELSLTDMVDPELRFAYWLNGDGALLVQLSQDGGKSFRDADTYTEPGDTWAQGVVRVREVFDDELPESVVARWIASSDGAAEAGVDDYRLVDVTGVCLERNAFRGCGCDANGDATPQSALAFAGVLLGVRALRRRRRA